MTPSSDDLMLRAAWLYYHGDLTHAEIARKLNTSRVKITRLLQRARAEGLVEIHIKKPLPIMYELADRLETTFGLDNVVIAMSGGTLAESLDAVGQAAAEYLMSSVEDGCNVGFGWSTTVSRIAPYLNAPPEPVSCVISELAGSMLGQGNPYSISARVAEILGAEFKPLSVPVLLQSEAARATLLEEPRIQEALAHARRCDIGFVGIGDVSPTGTVVATGYLTAEQVEALSQRGAIGDILMTYYDLEGRRVPSPFDDRLMALHWDELRAIEHLVVVAAGPHKVDPILGILRSGLCNCLITDTATAQAVLDRA